MQGEAEVRRALYQHADTIRRICILHLKNRHDVEDVFQEVFLKYALHSGVWESDEHERAWLIRVAINACKDVLKSFYRKRVSSLEDAGEQYFVIQEPDREVLDAVLRLPQKYRDVIYLHYFEGYKAWEIAAILKKKENTIYSWLARAREQLRRELGGEPNEN